MFIGVGIDSDHYTQLDYIFDQSAGYLLDKMEAIACETMGPDYSIEWTFTPNLDFPARCDVVSNHNQNRFYVITIFEIKDDSSYILVNWHAYNGVDFNVDEFKDLEEARKILKDRYLDMHETYSADTSGDENLLDLDISILDTGYEWIMQEIVENTYCTDS